MKIASFTFLGTSFSSLHNTLTFLESNSCPDCKITGHELDSVILQSGHELDSGNVKVLCRKEKLIPRKVKEPIFIKKEPKPTLNRDGGRELSKIYDSLLAINTE